jgi:hypothetical protein
VTKPSPPGAYIGSNGQVRVDSTIDRATTFAVESDEDLHLLAPGRQ